MVHRHHCLALNAAMKPLLTYYTSYCVTLLLKTANNLQMLAKYRSAMQSKTQFCYFAHPESCIAEPKVTLLVYFTWKGGY